MSFPAVHFHILNVTNWQQAWLFVCQLLESAYTAKQTAYVRMASAEAAEKLDAFLWTYREDSFLPHQLLLSNEATPSPIQIGDNKTVPDKPFSLLINLANDIPNHYQQYEKIIEIVFSDPIVQQLARDRYKLYRDHGCELQTHKY